MSTNDWWDDVDSFDSALTPKGKRLAELLIAGWDMESALKICDSEYDEAGDKRDTPKFDA